MTEPLFMQTTDNTSTMVPPVPQHYPSYSTPSGLTPGGLAAPYPPSSGLPTQASYYTAQDVTPGPDMYHQAQPRRPTEDGPSSYFPSATPVEQYQYHNQSPAHTPSPGPQGSHSPLHINPALAPAATAFVSSPVSAGTSRQQSVGGPRPMGESPTRENSTPQHNWNVGHSDEGHTVLSEAPPQYNPYDATSSSLGFGAAHHEGASSSGQEKR